MIVAAGASGPRLFPRLLAWMAERFPPANSAAAVLVWAAAFGGVAQIAAVEIGVREIGAHEGVLARATRYATRAAELREVQPPVIVAGTLLDLQEGDARQIRWAREANETFREVAVVPSRSGGEREFKDPPRLVVDQRARADFRIAETPRIGFEDALDEICGRGRGGLAHRGRCAHPNHGCRQKHP